MNKNYWLSIQSHYPRALAHCIDYFRQRHPEDWRDPIRQPALLLPYFAAHHIRIDILLNRRYGFIVRGNGTLIRRTYFFSSRLRAEWQAIAWAFMLRQEMLQDQHRTSPRLRFGHKRKDHPGDDGGSWTDKLHR